MKNPIELTSYNGDDRREVSKRWTWDKRIPIAWVAALAIQLMVGVSAVSVMWANVGHNFENINTKLMEVDSRLEKFDAELLRRTLDRYTAAQARADNNNLQIQIDNNTNTIRGLNEALNRAVGRMEDRHIRIEEKLDKIIDKK